jgi:hypothetical protein
VAEEKIRPESVEGSCVHCPCGALVEVPRFRTPADVKALPKEVRALLAIVTVNGGPPVVATIRCSSCIRILDLTPAS